MELEVEAKTADKCLCQCLSEIVMTDVAVLLFFLLVFLRNVITVLVISLYLVIQQCSFQAWTPVAVPTNSLIGRSSVRRSVGKC